MEWLRFDWTAIIAERKIKQAIDDGDFDDISGKGEPLNLDESVFANADQRIANKILKNANALPDWLQLEKDIDRERLEVTPRRERTLRALQLARNIATRERIADRLRRDHRERIDTVNTMITKYNISAPQAAQRVFAPYSLRREMQELEEAIQAALLTKEKP